ncbi:hypothetical protein DIPPA_25638 [Diplonema papillatum]|nr:hypothetical protein DIPPA_25638 [Diplonema papillatum]
MAAEYDDKLRMLIAEEPKAAEDTVFLEAAKAKMLDVYPGVLNELYRKGISEARTTGVAHHREPTQKERGEVSARAAPPPRPPGNHQLTQAQQRPRRSGGRTRQHEDEGHAKRSKPNG